MIISQYDPYLIAATDVRILKQLLISRTLLHSTLLLSLKSGLGALLYFPPKGAYHETSQSRVSNSRPK
jgi:hypothetical protein